MFSFSMHFSTCFFGETGEGFDVFFINNASCVKCRENLFNLNNLAKKQGIFWKKYKNFTKASLQMIEDMLQWFRSPNI